MGMYTEICLNVKLSRSTPQQVIDVLRYMTDDDMAEPALPDHEFFKAGRWAMTLRGSSYYFVPFSSTKLQFDDISKAWYLCARADLKNYDDEIVKFYDWLESYIDASPGEFIGYSRYEESDQPKLYFKRA